MATDNLEDRPDDADLLDEDEEDDDDYYEDLEDDDVDDFLEDEAQGD